jgi:chromosome segregation ATPase
MDEAIRQLSIYRDKYLAGNKRIERLETQLGEALEELSATRAELQRYRRESESLEKRFNIAQEKAAWYRSKLLGFVTTQWIRLEKAKDGF